MTAELSVRTGKKHRPGRSRRVEEGEGRMLLLLLRASLLVGFRI